jgi:hypothetical protein
MAKKKRKARARASAGAWSAERMACVATYKVLEGDEFLDQFEDAEVPFADAAGLQMGELLYYPKTTGNASIIRLLSLQIAQRFLHHIVSTFTVKKEDPDKDTAQTVRDLAAAFADKTATLSQLAEVVDANVRFPGE